MQETRPHSSADALSVLYDQAVEALADQGWFVADGFLSADDIEDLALQARRLQQNGQMSRAGVSADRVQQAEIRGDRICWLEAGDARSAAEQRLADKLEALKTAVNRALFLGLYDLEAHYAIYPTGAFYKRHLDQFRDTRDRQLTVIAYLNRDWREEDGGKLRLYLDDTRSIDIAPLGGRLVTFLSERFWHEVLPATRERLSVTGWFRTRSTNPF